MSCAAARRRMRGITLVDIVVVTNVVVVAVLFLAALETGLHSHNRRGSNGIKCGNNLKQIGMAAIQYSDDKRFFPSLVKPRELQGGWKTNTAARICRSLVFYNYNENPESFICPASPDQFHPLNASAKFDIRAFRWAGAEGNATDPPPLFQAAPSDSPLHEATDLSYGWTRRGGLTSNTVSIQPVAGDKARIVEDDPDVSAASKAAHKDNMIGNHKETVFVVCVDAHTIRVTKGSDAFNTKTIAATEGYGAGFLGVLGDDPELGQ